MPAMADEPRFLVVPPLRCWYRNGNSADAGCLNPARWMRQAPAGELAGYFCGLHSETGDVAIPFDARVCLVRVTMEVLVSGTSLDLHRAEIEAIAVLEDALERAGAWLNLHTVSTVVGRPAAPAPPGASSSGGGVG